jgi:2-polyprenyl-3-methyl-5-hydroxy-6-metoxy-1,4-benzoquinol methylase
METMPSDEAATAHDDYYERVRTELLDLFPTPPSRLLDVGCAEGRTSAAAKSRWPGVRTFGIEVVPEAAERARAHVDELIAGSAESLDLGAAGLHDIDGVILADVLEHLVDPWAFLRRLHAVLTPGATVVASIPNVANLWLLEELAAGRFDYAPSGLLDITHLRFFTRSTIAALFGGTGYAVVRWERKTDGRVDDLTRKRILGIMLPEYFFGRVAGRRVRVNGQSPNAYHDLRTLQFLVVAHAQQQTAAPVLNGSAKTT